MALCAVVCRCSYLTKRWVRCLDRIRIGLCTDTHRACYHSHCEQALRINLCVPTPVLQLNRSVSSRSQLFVSHQVSQAKFAPVQSSLDRQRMSETRKIQEEAIEVFDAAVQSVFPPDMVQAAVTVSDDGNCVTVDGRDYQLDHNVYVVGFGKAVSGMARGLEDLLGRHIVEGVISIPHGSQKLFTSIGKHNLNLSADSKIRVYEGAKENLPDEDSHAAAMEIMKLAKGLKEHHLLFVLISGGGSALLPTPVSPLTLEDELQMTRVLGTHGASIHQLNVLRQNLETLKGGGLADIAKPAKVVSLILSDVVGDKLDIISSGPTVPLLSSARQALQILDTLQVKEKVPPAVVECLQMRALERKERQSGSPLYQQLEDQVASFGHVQNVIIGSNTIATKSALQKAKDLGYVPLILANSLQGEARDVAAMFCEIVKYIVYDYGDMPPDEGRTVLAMAEVELMKHGASKSDIKRLCSCVTEAYNSQKDVCIIAGGETTVNVTGTGKGGRNQEMALAFGLLLDDFVSADKTKFLTKFHFEFLSAGTDGQDGPTDAAGAVVNKNLVPMAISAKMRPSDYLDNNDSYTLFSSLTSSGCLIQSGLTGTNVMDIQVLIVNFIK